MSRKKKELRRIESKVISLFNKNPSKQFNHKQIASLLQAHSTQSRNDIIRTLHKLHKQGAISKLENNSYLFNKTNITFKEGEFKMLPSGKAKVILADTEHEVLIPRKKTGRALHGDIVSLSLKSSKRSDNHNPSGEILGIVTRSQQVFTGVLHRQEKFGFIVSQNPRVQTDFFVPYDALGQIKDGDKVAFNFKDWPDDNASPTANILKSLGVPGEPETEMHAILHDYNLPYTFPSQVETEAEAIPHALTNDEIKKRRDLRDVLTFTIDPVSAKDYDDAISFKILEDNLFEIGIHIADVSHYVKPGTHLDEEAFQRATSVYLVDRVVPMLPEALSNGVCSLRPNEDKYTFSALFKIDKSGKVLHEWYGKTVIHSDHRFSYEEVQWILDTESPHVADSISLTAMPYTIDYTLFESLTTLDTLAKLLRAKRMKAGAISFDRVEINFQLNAENQPVNVHFKTSKDAHKLIEEFMLLANRSVATRMASIQPKVPFVYRVHDVPDPDKLFNLKSTISHFGYQLNLQTKHLNKGINTLLKDCAGTPEQNFIDTLTLRCMSKAVYTTDNIGHYGLAFEYYTHFTSPIRRYPDILVHRLLASQLNGTEYVSSGLLEESCKHASEREQLATKAERDSVKYMQIVFMQDKIGKQFRGVISGVTERSLYVEIIENKCEGMIRLNDMSSDFFIYDEFSHAVVGKRTGTVYRLGDEVDIVVENANVIKRHLDFSII